MRVCPRCHTRFPTGERFCLHDSAMLVEDEVTIAIQVLGKLRDTITVAKGLPREEIEALALANEKVQRALDGKAVKKVIVVPDRLVNLVA